MPGALLVRGELRAASARPEECRDPTAKNHLACTIFFASQLDEAP